MTRPTGPTALNLIRTAAVAMNTKIGAFEENLVKHKRFADEAVEREVTLVVFPEGSLCGYPTEDLTYFPDFLTAQWEALKEFATYTITICARKNVKPIFVVGLTTVYEGMPYNAQAWVCNGKILGIIPKEELPSYFSFADGRNYNRGFAGMHFLVGALDPISPDVVPMGDLVFQFPFGKATGAICEDGWVPWGGIGRRSIAGDAILCAISNASDWRLGVDKTRIEMLSTRSSDFMTTLVSAYQVGAHAGTIYDGGALFFQLGRHFTVDEPLGGRFLPDKMFAQDFDLNRVHTKRRENTTFRQHWEVEKRDRVAQKPILVDCLLCGGGYPNQEGYAFPLAWKGEKKSFFIPDFSAKPDPEKEFFSEIEEGLIMVVGDFIEKNGFKRAVVLNSGGRDSFTVLMLLAMYAERRFNETEYPDAEARAVLRADFVHCYSMPTKNNSDETRSVAQGIAEQVGFTFVEVPIQGLFEEVEQALQLMLKDIALNRVDKQNIQARLRGALGRSVCATLSAAVIGTGNATERGRVFYTKGGDQESDLNLLGGTPKEVVNAWLAYKLTILGWPVLAELLETDASAELEPGQKDDNEMGPVPINDQILPLLLGERLGRRDIIRVIEQNFSPEELLAMDDRANPEMLRKWVGEYVRSCLKGAHKHDQDPPAARIGSVHIDPKRINRIPLVLSIDALECE